MIYDIINIHQRVVEINVQMVTFYLLEGQLKTHTDQVAAAQETWNVGATLVYCWASVEDGGPAVNQRWANVSRLLGVDIQKNNVVSTSPTASVGSMLVHRFRRRRNVDLDILQPLQREDLTL